MPMIIPALLAGGSFLSSLFGGGRQTTTRDIETPGAFRGLESVLIRSLVDRLASPSALPAGIEETGIRGINDTFGSIGQTIQNSLLSRGLSASPMAGAADRNVQLARGGEIARFRAGLPALERQLRNEDLGLGMDLFRSRFPTQTSTTTVSGSAGQGLEGMASILAYLYGSGAFDGTANTGLTGTLVR